MRAARWAMTAGIAVAMAAVAGCGAGEQPGESAEPIELADARQQVMDLYIQRQEYIEMYFGEGGALAAGEALADAVETSEERFHDVINLMSTVPEPEALAAAVEALDAQYDRVLDAAEAADASLVPSEDVMIEGTPDGGLEEWTGDVLRGMTELTEHPIRATGSGA